MTYHPVDTDSEQLLEEGFLTPAVLPEAYWTHSKSVTTISTYFIIIIGTHTCTYFIIMSSLYFFDCLSSIFCQFSTQSIALMQIFFLSYAYLYKPPDPQIPC